MNYRMLLIVLMLIVLPTSGFAASSIYEYDELDRLQYVTLENGQKITYVYDEIGNMISKTVSGDLFTITASSTGGGSIIPNGVTTIASGGSMTYTFTPTAGNQLLSVIIDNKAQGAISSYPFSNIVANHTIVANFPEPQPLPSQPIHLCPA